MIQLNNGPPLSSKYIGFVNDFAEIKKKLPAKFSKRNFFLNIKIFITLLIFVKIQKLFQERSLY